MKTAAFVFVNNRREGCTISTIAAALALEVA